MDSVLSLKRVLRVEGESENGEGGSKGKRS